MITAFPDIVMEPQELLIDGTRIVQITRLKGTHFGHFFSLPPSGRHVEVEVALLMFVEKGLVTEERRIYDFTGLLVQTGVLKAKPTV
jgi:Predicted ester cyclase